MFDISTYIDLQYIVGMIIVSRYILNYSPFKDNKWIVNHKVIAVSLLAFIIGVGFIIYDVKINKMQVIACMWKIFVSYCVATSLYETVGKKIFELIEKLFGVNQSQIPPQIVSAMNIPPVAQVPQAPNIPVVPPQLPPEVPKNEH